MNYGKFQEVADYVQSCLSADDFAHTDRVFGYALQLLNAEKNADTDIVLLGALLHDIGRSNGRIKDHHKIGSKKSREYLTEKGYSAEIAGSVAECVLAHSSDAETEPQTLEAKILFDADKLDMTGAVGIVRTIAECVKEKMPLCVLDENFIPLKGKKDEPESLLKRYKQELKKPSIVFFTKKAKKIAGKNQKAAGEYFKALVKELDSSHKTRKLLHKKMT
ncbi:MAG: HD domain-containing protein [Defluviitaleaceae bacterium]|nr:HD domain-containing protein [Defluviitaleaceae bacterium]MCL2262204.1 HD domain-containing protein [Defluviitaleaceae bacterium]